MLTTPRRQFSIFISEGFSLLAYSSLTSTMRLANAELGHDAYVWTIMGKEVGPVRSNCGVELIAETDISALRDMRKLEIGRCLALLTGDCEELPHGLVSTVRAALARGGTVVSFNKATLLLAQQGILDGRKCALHWKHYGASVENFPKVSFTLGYFETDGVLHTCAGEAVAADWALEIVKQDFGIELRDAINETALHNKPRSYDDKQSIALHMRLQKLASPLLAVIKLMEKTISDPMSLDELLKVAGVTRRHVERMFQAQLGVTPLQYYRRLRIERAQELLENTVLPILDVAMAAGFVSPSHFSKVYRVQMGCTPQEARMRHHMQLPSLTEKSSLGFHGNMNQAPLLRMAS